MLTKTGTKKKLVSLSKSALITNNRFVIQKCTITFEKAHSEQKTNTNTAAKLLSIGGDPRYKSFMSL